MTEYRRQEPPYTVKVELTEGCNLRCPFCGLQGIRKEGERNFKFASAAVVGSLFRQMKELGWNARIEFTMHGEPTMHPEAYHRVALARGAGLKNQLMMTSNGGGLLAKPGPVARIKELFDAGLNILALDDYEHANIIAKIRPHKEALAEFCEVYEYPEDPRGNPHRRHRPGYRMISIMADPRKAAGGVHNRLSNHSGAGSERNDSCAGKRCHRPFRELAVRWDGNVGLCCNDWRGELRCGNIVTDGLEAVWQGNPMNAARQMLYHGQRTFGPCRGCDSHSHRVGLLPDPRGNHSLPLPGPQVAAHLAEALAPPYYTEPAWRPWEKDGGK